jgi:hypothetical protein
MVQSRLASQWEAADSAWDSMAAMSAHGWPSVAASLSSWAVVGSATALEKRSAEVRSAMAAEKRSVVASVMRSVAPSEGNFQFGYRRRLHQNRLTMLPLH